MHLGLRDFVARYFQHMICCLWVCVCVAPDSHKIILKGQHECKHVTYARVDGVLCCAGHACLPTSALFMVLPDNLFCVCLLSFLHAVCVVMQIM